MLLSSILATVAAFTVSSRLEVPITRIYAPVVVGKGDMHDNRVSSLDSGDVTQAQIDAARAALVSAGIPAERIALWSQVAKAYAPGGDKAVKLAILVIDAGAPSDAPEILSKLPQVNTRSLMFGWNLFVQVDCNDMQSRINAQLGAQAKEVLAQHGASAKLLSLDRTTDPGTGSFDPVPMCGANAHPLVQAAISFGRPQTSAPSNFTMHVSANVRFSYSSPDTVPSTPPNAVAAFPFSTFGFPQPIIGHQNRQFILKGGRFAATPGASDVSVPSEIGVGLFYQRSQASLDKNVRKAHDLNISDEDMFVDPANRNLYVRLYSVTHARWQQIESALWDGNGDGYVFVSDCAPYARYAQAEALDRSHLLAKVAAATLSASLGPLVVQTDWAGSGTTATCGVDGSGDMAALVAYLKVHGRPMNGDPNYAWFSSSVYAAWQLGPVAPTIASQSIVERLVPVIEGSGKGQDVTGMATLTPDAYFVQQRTANDFLYSIVAAGGEAPKDAGNVITDCEAAQERGLANALKVAQLEQPVRSFYAKPASLLSISCLDPKYIGQTFSSMPTMYSSSSGTGAPQAEDTITVFP